MVYLWMVFYLLVIGSSVRGALTLTSTTATCGQTTTLTCSSADISKGDNYIWYTVSQHLTIYDNDVDGTIYNGKYNGTSTDGTLTLLILNTNADDAAKEYRCSHNYTDSNSISLQYSCPSALTITSTRATCGQTTTLTCSSPDISKGDNYSWYTVNPQQTIYYKVVEGTIQVNGKYNGTSTDGALTLLILNTNADDAAKEYRCSHNYTDSNSISPQYNCPSQGNNGNEQTQLSLVTLFCLTLLSRIVGSV